MHTKCGKYQITQKETFNSSNHHKQPCNCTKKEDCPWWRKCRTENIIYTCIASTSGHPDKVYLGTAEDLKKYIFISVVLKMRHKWIKPPWQSMFGSKSRDITQHLHWNSILTNLCHLILILQKVARYAYTKSLKFWHIQTKMSYGTKDQSLFLNVVILISIYCPTTKLMIDIPFNTFHIIA